MKIKQKEIIMIVTIHGLCSRVRRCVQERRQLFPSRRFHRPGEHPGLQPGTPHRPVPPSLSQPRLQGVRSPFGRHHSIQGGPPSSIFPNPIRNVSSFGPLQRYRLAGLGTNSTCFSWFFCKKKYLTDFDSEFIYH